MFCFVSRSLSVTCSQFFKFLSHSLFLISQSSFIIPPPPPPPKLSIPPYFPTGESVCGWRGWGEHRNWHTVTLQHVYRCLRRGTSGFHHRSAKVSVCANSPTLLLWAGAAIGQSEVSSTQGSGSRPCLSVSYLSPYYLSFSVHLFFFSLSLLISL